MPGKAPKIHLTDETKAVLAGRVSEAAPVSSSKLLVDIVGYIRRYVILPGSAYLPLALWALATHAVERFDCFPYIAAVSAAKRCGKTRLAAVLSGVRLRVSVVVALRGTAAPPFFFASNWALPGKRIALLSGDSMVAVVRSCCSSDRPATDNSKHLAEEKFSLNHAGRMFSDFTGHNDGIERNWNTHLTN
jgi:hypothetical protein